MHVMVRGLVAFGPRREFGAMEEGQSGKLRGNLDILGGGPFLRVGRADGKVVWPLP